nr:zinc finger, CCHC-type [Tanacetum cinerariifolium]
MIWSGSCRLLLVVVGVVRIVVEKFGAKGDGARGGVVGARDFSAGVMTPPYNDNKGKRKHHDNTRADPNKKAKPTCWKCGKTGHIKRDCKGATVHVCKDRCWFKTYESMNNGSILHMRNESTALVHERGCVDLRFSFGNIVSLLNVLHVPNKRKNLVSSSILNNCGYKQVIESNKFVLSKHAFMSTSKLNDSILWHARLGHVHFKQMQNMSKDWLIPVLTWTLKSCDLHATPSLGNKKYFVTFIDDALRFCYVYLLHSKDEALDTFKVFKTEVELQQGSLIKRFKTDRGGERGIECIFVGYAEHSKAFRFYVIEPNDSVSIYSIIESRDSIFDEKRFSSVPRPSQRSLINNTEDTGGLVIPKEVTEEIVQQPEPELRKRKRNRTP